MFPCLQELSIENCPNLVEVSLEALHSLRFLHISSCGDRVLRGLVHVASAVTKLRICRISGLSDEVWRSVMDYLGAVEELRIEECNEIRYLWESEAEASKVLVNLRKLVVRSCSKLVSLWRGFMVYLGAVEEIHIYQCNEIRYLWESEAEASKVLVNLRKLDVFHCSKLVRLGEKEEEDGCNQLTSLRMLFLFDCQNLERCNLPNNIQELCIAHCPMIASVAFPTGGHKLKSLKIVGCQQLPDTELPNTSMPIINELEVVSISGWPNLKSVNELTKFIRLTQLNIFDCRSIESFPADVLPTFTSLKRLTIAGCENMDVASFGLWPPNLVYLNIGGLKKPISQWGPQTFPTSLVDLRLWGDSAEEDDVTSGSQLSHILPSSLTSLNLIRFEKLETVSKGLQHLTSLQHLDIQNCPKMKDLPETLLPSLLCLEIKRCPGELKEKTSRRGSYWPLISYIPRVNTYF